MVSAPDIVSVTLWLMAMAVAVFAALEHGAKEGFRRGVAETCKVVLDEALQAEEQRYVMQGLQQRYAQPPARRFVQ